MTPFLGSEIFVRIAKIHKNWGFVLFWSDMDRDKFLDDLLLVLLSGVNVVGTWGRC